MDFEEYNQEVGGSDDDDGDDEGRNSDAINRRTRAATAGPEQWQ